MADAIEQERTEQPTPKRRADARAAGIVPRSQELTTAATLLGSGLVLAALSPALGRGVLAAFGRGLAVATQPAGALDAQGAIALIRGAGWAALAVAAPVVLALAGVALTVAAVQARGVLSAKPLGPDWRRLSPLTNVRRAAGAEAWAELVRSICKLAVVGAAVWTSLRRAWPDLLALSERSPAALAHVVHHHAVRLLVTAGAAYLALGAIDYLWQLRRHEQRLRMTRAEVRQEERETEGDPVVRHRMRGAGRALVRRRLTTTAAEDPGA